MLRLRTCANCEAQVSRPKSRAVEFGTINVKNLRKPSIKATYTRATRVVCKDRAACAERIAKAVQS